MPNEVIKIDSLPRPKKRPLGFWGNLLPERGIQIGCHIAIGNWQFVPTSRIDKFINKKFNESDEPKPFPVGLGTIHWWSPTDKRLSIKHTASSTLSKQQCIEALDQLVDKIHNEVDITPLSTDWNKVEKIIGNTTIQCVVDKGETTENLKVSGGKFQPIYKDASVMKTIPRIFDIMKWALISIGIFLLLWALIVLPTAIVTDFKTVKPEMVPELITAVIVLIIAVLFFILGIKIYIRRVFKPLSLEIKHDREGRRAWTNYPVINTGTSSTSPSPDKNYV